MSFFLPIRRLLACAALAILPASAQPSHQPLRAHPQNPYLLEFRGKPAVLRTFGEHYSSVINSGFNYPSYLDVLKRDRMNLTRVFLVAYRETPQTTPSPTPLAVPPGQYVQPWQRSADRGNALDGLGKWDFSTWNEDYFTRLKAFVGACGERGIVAELTLFCTYYTDNHWQASPFHPSNNVQGSGPANRYDCYRPGNANLLPVQEAVVRRITRELNGYDNWYFSIQNEPFWNQPGVKDDEEVAFHDTILGYIRDEESTLPHRHLVAHNFPQKAGSFSGNHDIINEHYPAAVPGSTIAGAEALLRDHYPRGKILSLDETDTPNPLTARLESWMFTHGGGAIYNGLNFVNLVYTSDNESGDTPIGNEQRATVRRLGTYLDNLDLTGLRRDLSWITSGLPSGSSQQSMSSPGQQYVAYLHHGKSGQYNFQLHYEPIDDAEQTATLSVALPAGNWRAVWTRPADLTVLGSQEFSHPGGSFTLAPVSYREDVALRIDRTGAGDTTPPPAPGDFTADASADGSIALGWRAVQAADLTGYRLHRADVTGFSPDAGNLLAELPAADVAYRDAAATLGTTFHYRLIAVDNQGNRSAASDELQATPGLLNRPYHGTPHPLPGVIQAEDFDLGGEGIAYSDSTPLNDGSGYRPEEAVDLEATTDTDGGHHVSSTVSGEWLEYTVHMEHAGGHVLAVRLSAAAAGGMLSFEIDGNPVSRGIEVPETGAGIWQTVTVPEVELLEGTRVLRLRIDSHAADGSAVLINWFSFTPIVRTGPTADAGADREVMDADFNGEETLTLDGSATVAGDGAITAYEWTKGGNVIGTGIAPAVTLPLGQHTVTLTVTDANGLQDTDELNLSVTARGFVNGGFENGYTGWTISGNHSLESAAPYVIPEGTRLVAFNNNERPPNGVLTQTFATVPGQLYVLSFDMGVLAYNNSQQKLQVQLTGTAPLLNVTHTTSRLNNQLIRWENKNHPFTADSLSTTLTFRDVSMATNALDLTLDNVRVIPQVTRTLTVSSSPGSAAVTLSPADTIGRTGGSTTLSRTYQNLTSVTLAAPVTSGGLTFQKWRKNGSDLTTSPSTTVLMDADHEFTAIYVAGPPVITSQPESAAVASGATATFRVTAAATVSLSYQWRFMGSPLAGATSDTLVISDVQPANSGSYDVVVTGSTGAVTSTPANLSVFSAGSLVNGSFEAGYTGWTFTGNQAIQTASLYTATDGTQLVAFNRGETPPNGVLSQTFATTPGQSYVLAFDMGVLAYNNSQQKLQVQVTGSTTLVNQTHTTNRLNNQLIRWESKSHPFIADSASTTLTFRDVSTATNALDLTLDNVRIIPQITRTLTVAADPASPVPVTVSPADTIGRTGGTATLTRTYQNLTTVTVTAPTTSGGMVFQKWRKNGNDLATTAAVSVVMDGSHTLTAVYLAPVTRMLTVESTPVGGVGITVSPADNNGQGNGSSTFTRSYADGAAVTLTAPATVSGHVFQKWRRDGSDLATSPAVSVTMDGNHTLTAVYQPVVLRTLTVTASDGLPAVTLGPADNNGLAGGTVTLTRIYQDGTGVTVAAPASIPGFIFEKWQRDGSDLATTTAVTVTMDADHMLHAVYQPVVMRSLAVSSTAGDTAFTAAPADSNGVTGGNGSATLLYPQSTTVTLSKPVTSGGYVFQKWQRNGADLATTPSVSVLMDADQVLTAVYAEGPPVIAQQPVNVTVAAGGSASFGVTVTSVSTPVYQWRFNGSAISGATSATFAIPNVQVANAGTYDVVVTTPGGSVTSNLATLALPTTGTLVNGSFENGYTGWTATGNQAVQTASLYTATDGTRLVSFNNGEVTPNGVLSQIFPTVPGQSYLLTFDMGVLAYNNSQQKLQVQVTGSATLVNQTHTTNRVNNQIIRWENKSHPFTADSTSTTLTFRDLSTATNALDLTLDNVRVIPQVTRTLSVTTSPAAGAVIGVSPLDTAGQGGGTTAFTRIYQNSTTVTLTAAAFTGGRTFQKWQRNGTDLATSSSVSVLVDADLTLTAVYVDGGPSLPSALKIMPLGDSITFGYDGNNAGYRGPLHNLLSPLVPGFQYLGTMALNPGSLPATPVDQRNHQGLSGYNILDVANNLDGLDTTRFIALGGADRNPAGGYWLTGGNGTGRQPMYPDVITMMIGTNDLFNPTGMENRLRNLISKLTTLRPDTKLFVAKITPAPNFPTVSLAYNEQVAAIVAEFRAIGKNVHLVDLHTGFPANGLGSDGLHPGPDGFLWMAQRWHDAILASYPPIDPTGPPLVTDPPDTGSVTAGGSVTLKVTAQGAGTLSYQWRFHGNPVPGATSTTLELANVQSSAAGTYDVVVSNAFGQVTSQPATLSVLVAAALANGSFEADLNNWTASGNVQARPGTNPYSATDGTKIATFNASNSTPNGALSQIVSTVPGTVYTLTFDLGLLSYNTAPQQIQVTATGGSSLLARNISITGPGNGTTRWFSQTATFTADGPTTTLTFRDISSSTNAIDLLLDNIRLTGGNAPAAMPAAPAAIPALVTIPAPVPAPLRGNAADLPTPDIGSVSLTGTRENHIITLNAVMGGRYFLERSSNLTDWEPTGDDIVIDTPALLEFPAPPLAAEALSGGQPLFYRIGRRPDPPAD